MSAGIVTLFIVNLTLDSGELLVVLGPSGCGKTTLLRLVAGLLRPNSGRVMMLGEPLPHDNAADLRRLRTQMGMLFQFGALFTDMSVYENVAFPLHETTDLSESQIKARVFEKLEAVGLADAAYKMPAEISGGMARRVALARAIALDPMLIMYDEPFAGLDPISMGVIGQLIRKLNDALGATTLLVTHDVQEALQIVDYVYFVSDGQIVAQGTADEIRASDDPFVHQFVFGEADGPVHFHYPAEPFRQELMRERANG